MKGSQWHQLDHMQIIFTLIQTDNHASTSPLSFYRPDALPATQPTASKQWRQIVFIIIISYFHYLLTESLLCTCYSRNISVDSTKTNYTLFNSSTNWNSYCYNTN